MKLLKVLMIVFISMDYCLAVEFYSGVISRGRDTVRNEEQKQASLIIKEVLMNSGIGKTRGIGYTNLGGGTKWYRFTKDMNIYGVDVNTKSLLGTYALTRTPYHAVSPVVSTNYEALHTQYPSPMDYEGIGPGYGCHGDHPLRYGDIEGDGKNELVILLNNLFMIFSPENQQVIYSEYINASDWMDDAEMQEAYGDKAIYTQYASQLMSDNDDIGYGVRHYAKLYFGDYDQDGNADIIAWRKSYRSNTPENPQRGFSKQYEQWQHYEKTNDPTTKGMYMPQTTDETTIKQWLTTANLTWQKGYPDKSECAGQEGQPIPEMSDPLLNDPDVLQ